MKGITNGRVVWEIDRYLFCHFSNGSYAPPGGWWLIGAWEIGQKVEPWGYYVYRPRPIPAARSLAASRNK